MTSTESTEPKGSDDSSTNPRCGCGHLRSSHFDRDEDTAYCIGNRNLCPCDDFQLPVEQIHKWKRCMGCGHQEHFRRCMTMVEETGDNCRCLQLTSAQEIKDRCMGAGGCPEHPTERQRPTLAPEEEACNACGHSGGEGCGCPAHAFVSKAHCHRCEGTWLIKNAMVGDAEPPPPQPLRRPPYAVAYSVAGHLYEIALPGDATVHATDGGLIITHALGPVAGVVRVHPIEGEQS